MKNRKKKIKHYRIATSNPQSQAQNLIYQIGVRDAGFFHQFGKHGDLSKARKGIDLVDIVLAFYQEHVHPCKMPQAQIPEDIFTDLLPCLYSIIRKSGR